MLQYNIRFDAGGCRIRVVIDHIRGTLKKDACCQETLKVTWVEPHYSFRLLTTLQRWERAPMQTQFGGEPDYTVSN